MDMSQINANLASLQQALSLSVLQKSMHQDALSVATLLQGMEKANAKTMEASVTPHLGSSIDIYA